MLTGAATPPPELRRRLKVPALVGGLGALGLLGCIACCSLPLLGALGVGASAAVAFEILEPLSVGLLVLGAAAALVVWLRLRKSACRTPVGQASSCATDGSCGCGPAEPSARAPVER